MGKTVTQIITSVYDTRAEYDADVVNLTRYESDAAKVGAKEPQTQDRVLDPEKLTVSFKIAKRIE